MIRRVNTGRGGHYYVDTATGRRVPGDTSIVKAGTPTPEALINWHATATAEYAVNHWDELDALPVADRLKRITGGRYAIRDAAANKGTIVHNLAARLITGERVPIPDGLDGYVRSYVRFLDEFDVQPVLVERTVHNETYDYCGTLDLIADLIDDLRWLLDIKTGRSGVFGEVALQLAGYRYAEVWIDEDKQTENVMPTVDRTGVVHVRPDGYSLIPVEAGPAQFNQFLNAQAMAEFAEEASALVGAPIDPPTTSKYRLEVAA
jgi:hypothetical protein